MCRHIRHTAALLLSGKSMAGMRELTMALPAWQIATTVWSNRPGTWSVRVGLVDTLDHLVMMNNGKSVYFHSKDISQVGVMFPSLSLFLMRF